jgi:hypothetical protein
VLVIVVGCGPVAIGAAIGSTGGGGGGAPPSVTVIPELTAGGQVPDRPNVVATNLLPLRARYVASPPDAACEYQVDDAGSWRSASGGVVEVSGLSDGPHAIQVRQRDLPSASDRREWFLDRTGPGAPSGVLADAAIAHRLGIAWQAANDAAPSSGINDYEVTYVLDGNNGPPVITTMLQASLVGLPATRPVSVTIRARDRAGNPGQAATVLLRTDVGGDGTFAAASERAVDLTGARGLVRANFDDDRIPDVAVLWGSGATSRLTILRAQGANGRGNGTFTRLAATYPVPDGATCAPVDVDADGWQDVVAIGGGVASQLVVWKSTGNGTLQAGPSVPLPSAGLSMTTCDFNGDAIADVVVGTVANGVRVLRGEGSNGVGTGLFVPYAMIADGSRVERVVARDFDDDRVLDLLFAGPSGLYLARGTAVGAWAPPFQLLAAAIPAAADLLLADVDGDGIADPIVLSVDRTRVQIVKAVQVDGRALGTFELGASRDVGGAVAAFATADFDTDGIADLLLVGTNSAQQGVAWLLRGKSGAERGTFGEPTSTPISSTPTALAIADFDARGTLDVLVASAGDGRLLLLPANGGLGKGNGTFRTPLTVSDASETDPVRAVAAADFDRDGVLDLVYGLQGTVASVRVRRGNSSSPGVGDGTFGPPTSYTDPPQPVFDLVPVDLNGDRFLDVVGAHFPPNPPLGSLGAITQLLGRPGGVFVQLAPQPTVKAKALVTGLRPERADIVAVGFEYGPTGNVQVFRDERPFAYSVMPQLALQQSLLLTSSNFSVNDVALGDFNRDGIRDLVTVGNENAQSGWLRVAPGLGDGTFGIAPTDRAVRYAPLACAVGDFDGDRKADVIVANRGTLKPVLTDPSAVTPSLQVFFGNGTGSLETNEWLRSLPFRPSCLAIADFDGDAIDDVAVGAFDEGTVLIAKGTRIREYPFDYEHALQVEVPVAEAYHIKAHDIDSDGILDLLLCGESSGNGRVVLLLGNGTYPVPLQ